MNKLIEEIVKSFDETIVRGYGHSPDEKFLICKNNKIWDKGDLKSFFISSLQKAYKAGQEDTVKDIKVILNRCKTERGLGVALGNYIKTLTK